MSGLSPVDADRKRIWHALRRPGERRSSRPSRGGWNANWLFLAAAVAIAATLAGPTWAAGKNPPAPAASEAEEEINEPLLVIPRTPAAETKKSAAKKASAPKRAAEQTVRAPIVIEKSTSREAAGTPEHARSALPKSTATETPSTSSHAPQVDSNIVQTSASEEPPLEQPIAHLPATTALRTQPRRPAQAPVRQQHRTVYREVSPAEHEDHVPSLLGGSRGRTVAHAEPYNGAWHLASADGVQEEPVPTPDPAEGEPFMPYGGGPAQEETFYSPDDDVMFDELGDPFVIPGRRWTVIAGGEAMLLRSHFSQSAAMTETITTQTGASTTQTENQIGFNPGYQGAFRAYLGFRNCACGDEIRFAFLNYNGAENLRGTAVGNTQFCDFLCNQTPNPGDSVNTHFNLGASIWDLDCIRPFFQTQPCNDVCGPKCHPWDLRWFLGLRVAYINHNISSLVTDATASDGISATASAVNRFTGFGPRLGLQGRKYFGQGGRFSVYGRGAGSLLVGNVYQDVINSNSSIGTLPVTTVLNSRNSRIIPVAELEVGGTWWMAPRFAVSGGWMLMSFWDLGLQETGGMSTPILNNSNILGFDGFFVRGELVF